ncbi:nucleotidyl transferase AbiEii/AbiGii toxin family protein [Sphingosinicella rhizophila]|uniref:Nucleotidyl transferase AbiEii/AbiGii toxin family protein n=1 Tax=Sphingosinicella rhizophila TaxID=3050082 RepID=A0ABU3Q8Y3_9SPHN|nr:nucleotidyl transferase AbiEii/AbiGii toxin family protein [Sphingosinicella sp. GR2756]MDT9599865.1 nucleotidyl transferase AbiEii/AbiGii toxin family protein [Sphingosinicella sp. GR2756]
MADDWLRLTEEDRREVLNVAASASGRPPHLLEKDVWVVWTLNALFGAPIGERLVFKGGTSLSKVYGAIRRFSEDIDLTYDIRRLAPDLVGETGDALPATRSEEKRWSSAVRARLPAWVKAEALPLVAQRLEEDKVPARAVAEKDKIFIEYEALTSGSGYVAPRVMLEFGARSTGEPSDPHEVGCDAAPFVESVVFPTARPRVMRAERTFWEKATAVHVFCSEGPLRGDRFARHWHDLARLDEVGFADKALADRSLADAVAAHKSWFFAEKDGDRQTIDYRAAVSGGLRLVPDGASRDALAEDYAKMVEDGLLLDEAEPFDDLMARMEALQDRANAAAAASADES